MSEEIESLRAEVAALRAELSEGRELTAQAMTRRRLLTGLAGLGAAGAASVTSATPAGAADGDPLTLGEDNDATTMTRLVGSTPGDTGFEGLLWIEQQGEGEGLTVIGQNSDYAIVGFGGFTGIFGSGAVGIEGTSDQFVGVFGSGSDSAAGLGARSEDGPGLYIEQSAFHAYLKPTGDPGPPSSDVWDDEVGMINVDSNADIWLCTAGGDPGTWTRLVREDTAVGRTVPIAPMRALDSRATGGRPSGSPTVPGQKKGPLRGGEAVTLDLAGAAPIPASASGVVGNLTVTSPSYNGYLIVGPSGTTPSTSALNFTTGATVANAFTSQLGPAGITIRGSGTTSNRYELIVDITAYIT